MKSLFVFRKVIVLLLLLLESPQYITAQKAKPWIVVNALWMSAPKVGSWPRPVKPNPIKYKSVTANGLSTGLKNSFLWHSPNTVSLCPRQHDIGKAHAIHKYEHLKNGILAPLVQDHSFSNLNGESLTSIPSLTPELFNALACSIAEHPDPLFGTWRIGWMDAIQEIGLNTSDDIDIHNLECIKFSPEMISYHCGGYDFMSFIEDKPDFISLNHESDLICNEIPQLTRIGENYIALDFYMENCSRRLILQRIPTSIDHTIDLRRALYSMPANPNQISLSVSQLLVEKDIQSQYANELESKQNGTTNELSVPISTPINDSDWWLEYIKHEIEEQMIKLGMQIQFDFEMEEDTIGFIIYTYEYEYKPEAA